MPRITLSNAHSPETSRPKRDPLQASELRYRRLFETARDGILILDADSGHIVDVNPYLEVLLGYEHSELLGRTLWEIGPFRDSEASQEAFRRLQADEYVRYDNLPLETRDRQRRQVEFVSNVYMVDGKRVIQCNIRDITERRKKEERAQKSTEKLLALVTELRRRDRDLQQLSDLNELLQSCTTREEAYQVLELKAGELFAGQSGCLAILQTREQSLVPAAYWGPERPIVPRFQLGDCWALRRGHPHDVEDPDRSVLCLHFARRPEESHMCVPLTVQGETLGVLCLVGGPAEQTEGRSNRLHMAVAVGETIKLVLSNLKLRERLREQANHDPLTELFNRRYLDDSLPRELGLSGRRDAPLSVAVLDIDNFKRFNDLFGHDAGDLALRECALVLTSNLRKSDIACRLGGEEFVLVMPDSSLADTRKRVEDICTLVRKLELRHHGQLLGPMTLSAGIAGSPEHATSSTELLHAADTALYAAKEAGRDRVVVYETRGKTP